jgi:prophage regulatory protein
MASHIATNERAPITSNAATAAASLRILRLPQVRAVTGLGRSMIYQMEAEGRFPPRVSIGARAVGWVGSELQDWLRRRIEMRGVHAAPQTSRSST